MWEDSTYSTKLISFELFGLAAAKSAFVHQVWKFLFHELVNFLYGFLEPRLGRACDVKVKWWIL